jgi:hypothetical protein
LWSAPGALIAEHRSAVRCPTFVLDKMITTKATVRKGTAGPRRELCGRHKHYSAFDVSSSLARQLYASEGRRGWLTRNPTSAILKISQPADQPASSSCTATAMMQKEYP